jgi:hypothetical protein
MPGQSILDKEHCRNFEASSSAMVDTHKYCLPEVAEERESNGIVMLSGL